MIVGQVDAWAALLGLALMFGVGAAAWSALAARSLFSTCVGLGGAAALAACAVLAMGDGDGALALALIGAGLTPLFLLGALLLSARATKARPRPWISIALSAATVAVIVWVAPELAGSAPTTETTTGSPALWIAALLFVAVCASAGMLGYGERGLLGNRRDGAP